MAEPELSTLELARGVSTVYMDAEYALLRKLAGRLSDGIEAEDWAGRKLAEITALRSDISAILAQAGTDAAQAMPKAVGAGWSAGQARAKDEVAEQLGKVLQASRSGPTVEAMVRALYAQVTATHLPVVRAVEDVYRSTIVEASRPLAGGVYTRQEATQRALDDFANAGIRGFTDRSGRRWDIASYAEMATRTQVSQASVEGHVQGIQSAGAEYVRITDHSGECPICRPFEGKVYRIGNAGNPQYPLLTDATSVGLFHPGCRHRTMIYIHGISPKVSGPGTGKDPQGYEARQRQREMERTIRKWKKREAVAISEDARLHAKRARLSWSKELDRHVKSNNLKRLRYREVAR